MNPILVTGVWAWVYSAVILFSWLGSVIFPVWYGFTRPWFKSVMGQHLMAFSSVVSVAMTLVAIRPLFGSGPLVASPLGILLVALLGACCWWRVWLFYRFGRDDRE